MPNEIFVKCLSWQREYSCCEGGGSSATQPLRMLLGALAAPQGGGDPRSQHHLASECQRDIRVVNPI